TLDVVGGCVSQPGRGHVRCAFTARSRAKSMVFRRPRGQSGRQCVAKYSESSRCGSLAGTLHALDENAGGVEGGLPLRDSQGVEQPAALASIQRRKVPANLAERATRT